MKRTTYILLGMTALGWVLIVAVFLFVALFGQRDEIRILPLSSTDEQPQNLSLCGVHAVTVDVRTPDNEPHKQVHISSKLTISSVSAGNGARIIYPQHPCLSVTRTSDTLHLSYNFSDNLLPEHLHQQNYFLATKGDIQIESDSLTSLQAYDGPQLQLRSLSVDSLSVYACHQLLVDSCHFRALSVNGENLQMHAQKSRIQNFHACLNGIRQWSVKECNIDTEFLSGNRTHRNELQKGECRRIIWTPIGEDGKLILNLQEKTEITLPSK